MEAIYLILALVWSVLCLILFFKVWGMTNNVKDIKEILTNISSNEKSTPVSTKLEFCVGDRLKVKKTGEYVVIKTIDDKGIYKIYECETENGIKTYYKDELIN